MRAWSVAVCANTLALERPVSLAILQNWRLDLDQERLTHVTHENSSFWHVLHIPYPVKITGVHATTYGWDVEFP